MSDAFASWRAFVDEVRDRNPLLDVVSADARSGGRSGRIDWFFSPFRSENTASFAVYDDGRYMDFGGDKTHGDVFSYVMRRDGCDFKTSLAWLANRVGLSYAPTPKDAEDTSLVLARRSVTTLQTRLQHLLHELLPSLVREHLRTHYGLSDETIDLEQIGWCPAGFFDVAKDELEVNEDELLSTGYFLRSRSGIVPLFTHRIVFPYWSRGHVVYAIGRLHAAPGAELEDYERAKYRKLLTSSENHLYVHASVHNEWFWGEDNLRSAREWAVFTEGITDAIALVQAGVPAASFVTTQHRDADAPKVLEMTRHLGRVYICNDADVLPDGTKPGLRGALKIASLLTQAGKDVRIVVLPKPEGAKKIDVNEYLRDEARAERDPGASFRALLPTAKTVPEVLFDEIPDGLDSISLEKRIAEIAASYPQMGGVTEAIIAKAVAKRFELPKAYFSKLLKGAQREAVKTDPVSPPTPTDRDRMRGSVDEEIGYYYVRSETGTEPITNFSLNARAIVETEQGKLVQADVIFRSATKKGISAITFPRAAWNGKRRFIDSFPDPNMNFTGGDDHVQGILNKMLSGDVPYLRGTGVLGLHKTDDGYRYVLPDRVLTASGDADPRSFVYAPSQAGQMASIAKKLSFPESDRTVDLAKKAIPLLLDVNDPEVVLPILSHTYASAWKPLFRQKMGHFPILNVVGQKGSGKTTLVTRVFWPLQGAAGTDSYACTETPFVLLKLLSSSNSFWIPFDEFRSDMNPSKMENFLRNLRRVYNGDTEERGHADQTTTSYELTAPVVVMGESAFEDPALQERILPAYPNRSVLRRNKKYREAAKMLESLPLRELAAPYLRWVLRSIDYFPTWLEEAEKKTDEFLADAKTILPARVRDNIVVMTFGAETLNRWTLSMGFDLADVGGAWGKEGTLGVISEVGREASVETSKDPFDAFLEQFSFLARERILVPNVHYKVEGDNLAIALEACHQLLLLHQSKSGKKDGIFGIESLRRSIREKKKNEDAGEKDYVLHVDSRVRFTSTRPRCVILSIPVIIKKKHIDFAIPDVDLEEDKKPESNTSVN